jgi:hypothetical protein
MFISLISSSFLCLFLHCPVFFLHFISSWFPGSSSPSPFCFVVLARPASLLSLPVTAGLVAETQYVVGWCITVTCTQLNFCDLMMSVRMFW